MRIRPLPVIAVAAFALAGLSACQFGAATGTGRPVTGGSGAPASATPSASAAAASTTPSPSPNRAVVRACTDSHLRVTLSTEEGAAGTQVRRFILTNTGTVACTMKGHPFLSLYGPMAQDGSTVEANLDVTVGSIPANFGDLGAAATKLTLAPGHTAVFFLKWSNVPVDDRPCVTADGFDFRPPADADHNKLVALRFVPCGGQVQVSAILPATVGD